ncbi:zinc-binding dehydrogenase [Nocardia exalbida]|uniref:zinc-binding dehydrogenase n=1 Tax=Nocardia exalbida TaxID=290231 RepID=UPI0009FE635F|nr:zinc-binding dehydrogenase [Nocardia exalbida]
MRPRSPRPCRGSPPAWVCRFPPPAEPSATRSARAASGALRPTIAASFPLSKAVEAHASGDTGRTVGKLVLTVP